MCGIFGVVDYKGINNFSVEKGLSALSHRGPDAQGVFQSDGVALGHLRLSILDLTDAANQPMTSHCGRYVMVYNGEVYNFREIAAGLKRYKRDFHLRTQSDTEVILEAFVEWNTDFINRLNGMFAIAIWDKLKKKLFLFRDRLGIKPIYYYQQDGIIVFASELKVMQNDPWLKEKLTINPESINQFLHLGYIPTPNSIYSQVRKFPQGYWGVFSIEGFQSQPYWQPENFIDHDLRNQKRTESELLDELKELVVSSVKYRLVSDVPYGTFLSGGIDSSLVTAIAQSLHSNPVKTFSIGSWDPKYDESGYAKAVSEHLGTDHHSLVVSEKDALQWIPELTSIYDEPFADSSALPTLMVSKMARQHVTMTLSGDGGDELFMGYGAYRWAERLQNPLVRWFGPQLSFLTAHGPARYRRAAEMFRKKGVDDLRSHIFSQEQYLFSQRDVAGILRPDYLVDYKLSGNYPQFANEVQPSEIQAFFDLGYYLPDDLLVKVDRASMYFALETRVPLLDYRLVEWAINLPPEFKIKGGTTKWLLKKLLYSYVPAELFNRPKKGFSIPLQHWLKSDLKPFVTDYLSPDSIAQCGILDPKKVTRILDAFYKKGEYWQYNKIWVLATLQKWIRQLSI